MSTSDRIKRRSLLATLALFAAAATFLAPPRARADEPADKGVNKPAAVLDGAGKFIRFVDRGRTGAGLETGVVTYRNKDGATVTLVAAIHIGEESYFNDLNKMFAGYDAVLYELVKPKDVDIPVKGFKRPEPADGEKGGMNMIGEMQHFMKDTLNLSFQLDVIDYTKANFVHADLDRETFEKMQADRGESFETMMLQPIISAMSKPQPARDPAAKDDSIKDVVRLLTRPDAERQLKLVLARQMGDIENVAGGLSGEAGTIILHERNKACTKVLQKVLEGGKKKVAIFYGAAHMPELEDRLSLMGFKPVAQDWKQAWDLTIRADQPSAAEKLIEGLLKGLDDEDEPAEK